jgi:regulator of protease activity HflC (stomatin/prohibitin superfamily)
VRIVPQGYKWIVQRLGKYHATLSPGLNFVIPYVDEVAYKVTTKDIVLDIPSQEVITRDNAVLVMNAVAYINITTPEKAVYGIENYTWAIQNLVQTSLRSIVGEMDLMMHYPLVIILKPNLKLPFQMIFQTGALP